MFRKKVAQLKRVLREFPWLWAVHSSWTLGYHQVIIRKISRYTHRYALLVDSSESCQWWAKIDNCNQEKVVSVPHMEGARVAEAIIGSFGIGRGKIKYLATHDGSGTFTVFRAPRGEDLHKMVCETAFASEPKVSVE